MLNRLISVVSILAIAVIVVLRLSPLATKEQALAAVKLMPGIEQPVRPWYKVLFNMSEQKVNLRLEPGAMAAFQFQLTQATRLIARLDSGEKAWLRFKVFSADDAYAEPVAEAEGRGISTVLRGGTYEVRVEVLKGGGPETVSSTVVDGARKVRVEIIEEGSGEVEQPVVVTALY